ncbi:hypothetical protein L3Q82_019238 [Scortum barcoo]|uniref:Uncharacterized protein n=1 Tax=Scortum barcoo TaxID=214431 RepID=A0ACB8VBU6_9TELE|nr:hypothetical protein L3Q82_019238 [Scortum barcoo]
MWTGLKTLTDYKKKISSAEVMSASLPDELNTFYARFESTSPAVEVQKAQEDHCPPVISRADVCRTLKRINTRKAPGPDRHPRPSSQVQHSTTIVPSKLVTKLRDLGLNSALCDWILNFLTGRSPGYAGGQHPHRPP